MKLFLILILIDITKIVDWLFLVIWLYYYIIYNLGPIWLVVASAFLLILSFLLSQVWCIYMMWLWFCSFWWWSTLLAFYAIAEQFISFCLDLKSPSCLFVNTHSYRCHSQSCFCRRFRFSSLNFILNYTDLYID